MSRLPNRISFALLLLTSLAACTPPPTTADKVRELAQAGDFDQAMQLLRAEEKANGLTLEVGLLMGGIHEAQSNPSTAIGIYRKTAEQFPGSGEVELRMAEIYLKLDQIEASVKRTRKAREAGISDADTALPLAIGLAHLGQFEESSKELDRAEAAGVALSTIEYNRALIRSQAGDKTAAREHLLRALEGAPEDPSVLRELGRVELELAEGDDLGAVARAEEYVNRSLSISEGQGDGDWRAYEVLGDCFVIRKDWTAASEMFLQAKKVGREPAARLDDKYYDAQVMLRGLSKGSEGEDSEGQ